MDVLTLSYSFLFKYGPESGINSIQSTFISIVLNDIHRRLSALWDILTLWQILKQIVILETDGMCNFNTIFLNNNTWTHNKVFVKDFILKNSIDHKWKYFNLHKPASISKKSFK